MQMIVMVCFSLVLLGCMGQSYEATPKTTFGTYQWSVLESDAKEYETLYQIQGCSVYTSADAKAIKFVAQNKHFPTGTLGQVIVIKRNKNGMYETSQSFNIFYEQPEEGIYLKNIDFYDVFYAQCFKAALELPDPVKEFLKKYTESVDKEKNERDDEILRKGEIRV